MLAELRAVESAIRNRQIVPCFQPLVELRTGKLVGFEVLARWDHPEHGLILPSNFIALADGSGQIDHLTQQVLRAALTAAAKIPEPLQLAVNVSPTQLKDFKLPAVLAEIAEVAGFPLTRLTVEITETALLENLDLALTIARELKSHGCRLALDDFGTGYSSLAHLRSLPFDQLKIDRTFIASMNQTRDSRKIVAAVIGLAHTLDLISVGEGVETEDQADLLLSLGCELGQGWLYGRPVPATEVAALLAAPPHGRAPSALPTGLSWEISSLESQPTQRLAQLEAIYDGSPVGLCFLDRKLRYVSVNRYLAEMRGATVSSFIGKTVEEVEPALYTFYEPYLRRALSGEAIKGAPVASPSTLPGTALRISLASYEPAWDEMGEVIGVSVAVLDITDLKDAERAFRASEDRNQRTSDSLSGEPPSPNTNPGYEWVRSTDWASHGPVLWQHDSRRDRGAYLDGHVSLHLYELFMQAPTPLLIMTGPEHHFTFINAQYIRMLRRDSADSLLGKPIRKALPELQGQGFFETLDEVYRTGTTHVGSEEPAVLYREDTGVPEEAYFNFIYQPLRAANGQIEGIMVQATEVTAQVRSRQQSEQRAERLEQQWTELQALYRDAPIGFAHFDCKDYTLLRLNTRQREMFGTQAADALGQSIAQLLPMVPMITDLFDAVARGERVENQILTGEVKDVSGIPLIWLVNYTPIFAPDGSVEAISAVSLEISGQKRAEAALVESEKIAAVGRLASSIAHEISNPLDAVLNLIYLVRQYENLPEIQSLLDLADAELKRVSVVANQTLRFQRKPSTPQNVSCQDLFSAVLNMYETKLKQAQITVHKQKRAERQIQCFEGDIRQVLNNLIGNSIDAMPQGGDLFLRSREATHSRSGRRGLVLTVADTGAGMSAETQASVFKAFFTTKGNSGSGLGLWITSEIMVRHQGTIRIRSSQRSSSHGTVINVFLPFEHLGTTLGSDT